MALYFECRIKKNALLPNVFWRFCPLSNGSITLYLLWYKMKGKITVSFCQPGSFFATANEIKVEVPRWSTTYMYPLRLA